MRLSALAAACFLLGGAMACRGGGEAVPAAPGTAAGALPQVLELGMADRPGGATAMRETAPFGYRYQYLAGGVDESWTAWGGGRPVASDYIQESRAAGMIPVFTYYNAVQSAPADGEDDVRVFAALERPSIMRRYFADLTTFFMQAAAAAGSGPVILHVEPDLWGFGQRASPSGPAQVAVAVASTGLMGFDSFPDTLAGFAQAIVSLRDRLAPGVLLGYHVSTWASGHDFVYEDPPDGRVRRLAEDTAAFYRALGAPFDLLFAEFSDRDAGFKEHIYGDGGASWFTPEDFRRHALWISTLTSGLGLRAILWQIPYGNTQLRSMDNTWNHFQDNRVEWLLGERGDEHRAAYAASGVIALLFGRGADGATDASDAAADGITNPPPIGANVTTARSADDDGGLFRQLAAAYYRQGALALR